MTGIINTKWVSEKIVLFSKSIMAFSLEGFDRQEQFTGNSKCPPTLFYLRLTFFARSQYFHLVSRFLLPILSAYSLTFALLKFLAFEPFLTYHLRIKVT